MNKWYLLTFYFLFNLTLIGQTKKKALRDANIIAKATLESNFNKVLDYTHPSVLNIMGGKKEALQLIAKSMDEMQKQGFKLKQQK